MLVVLTLTLTLTITLTERSTHCTPNPNPADLPYTPNPNPYSAPAGPVYTVRAYPGATWALEEAMERVQCSSVGWSLLLPLCYWDVQWC
jgi:hypothetical protein